MDYMMNEDAANGRKKNTPEKWNDREKKRD